MFLVHVGPDKINDRDVMAGLTPRTKAVAEHETERGLQHRFIRLLQGSLFVKSQNFVSGGEFPLGTLQETFNLAALPGMAGFSRRWW